jgi:hypothetical protein
MGERIAVAHWVPVHREEPVALKDVVAALLHIDWPGWPIERQLCQCRNLYKSAAPREPSYHMPDRDDPMSVPYVFASWTRRLVFTITDPIISLYPASVYTYRHELLMTCFTICRFPPDDVGNLLLQSKPTHPSVT